MLDRGVIELGQSSWSSLVVLVTKKDGSTRLCVVNGVTKKDAYSLAQNDLTLDALTRLQYFSTVMYGKC